VPTNDGSKYVLALGVMTAAFAVHSGAFKWLKVQDASPKSAHPTWMHVVNDYGIVDLITSISSTVFSAAFVFFLATVVYRKQRLRALRGGPENSWIAKTFGGGHS